MMNGTSGKGERQPRYLERIAETHVEAAGQPELRATPTDSTPQCTNTATPDGTRRTPTIA
jgi:hypothetical protein